MKEGQTICDVLRAVRPLAQHPHDGGLEIMMELLQAGLDFHLGMQSYENDLGKEPAQRIRGDVGQQHLFRVLMAMGKTQNGISAMQSWLEENKSEVANLGTDVEMKDISMPSQKLFKLDLMLNFKMELAQKALGDDIEMLSVKYTQRLTAATQSLDQLCGQWADPKNLWRKDLGSDADIKEVLKTGLLTCVPHGLSGEVRR